MQQILLGSPLRRLLLRSASALWPMVASLPIFFYRDELGKSFGVAPSLVTTFAGLLVVLSTGGVLLLYLRGDFYARRWYNTPDAPWEFDVRPDVASEISDLDRRLRQFEQAQMTGPDRAPALTEEQRKKVLESIRTDVARQIITDLDRKYSAAAAEEVFVTQTRKTIENTYLRLRQEIVALTRRGNLNLVIGSITTAIAVALLAYMVLSETVRFDNLTSVLAHYIPRISTVAFIEIFSFFFLRLYRSTLAEIRFYQNELTNVSLCAVAIDAALVKGGDATRDKLVDRLTGVDRNLGAARSVSPAGDTPSKEVIAAVEQMTKLLSTIVGKP